MLRPGPRSLAPVLAALALGVAACGSDAEKTIPPERAETMLSLLDQVQASADAGNCQIAENGVTQLLDEVNALPAEVGTKTKDDLRSLVDSLGDLVQDPSKCQEPETGATGETTVVDPATTTSTTTTTSTEDAAPPEQPDEEGTGLEPGQSDNGQRGPNGNPNQGDEGGGGIGGD